MAELYEKQEIATNFFGEFDIYNNELYILNDHKFIKIDINNEIKLIDEILSFGISSENISYVNTRGDDITLYNDNFINNGCLFNSSFVSDIKMANGKKIISYFEFGLYSVHIYMSSFFNDLGKFEKVYISKDCRIIALQGGREFLWRSLLYFPDTKKTIYINSFENCFFSYESNNVKTIALFYDSNKCNIYNKKGFLKKTLIIPSPIGGDILGDYLVMTYGTNVINILNIKSEKMISIYDEVFIDAKFYLDGLLLCSSDRKLIKTKIDKYRYFNIRLLFLAREDKNSFFFEEYLPQDMFNIILNFL